MNRARVAALFAQQSAVCAALAEEFARADGDEVADNARPSPSPKSQPKITDIDRMKARKHLRKLGVPLR